MTLPRLDHSTHIADRLNELAAVVKTRSRASLTDASHVLEPIAKRFLNALFGWELENLNVEQANYPAADLGDRKRRVAIQVTNQDGSDKIRDSATKAAKYSLGKHYDRLIVFFLLPRKPGFPKKFVQPSNGPVIEAWDITDLLTQMQELQNLDKLANAAKVLDEELLRAQPSVHVPKFDISRILKYAPSELIGRDDERRMLTDAWDKVVCDEPGRPDIVTFVALGGGGKTSLVAKWAVDEMSAKAWPGCDGAFAWSFYSQGTRDEVAASSDLFLKEALAFFGDDADREFAASSAGAYDKGQRLARVAGQRRSLLILDGLEPLQYAPTAATPGQLKDEGLTALLRGLAQQSQGLCLVTTRYSVPDLKAFWQTSAREVLLARLSMEAGVHLLKTLGVKGATAEFEKLVEDVKGHALTLTLLGNYLRDAHNGDIRRRDVVGLEEADAEEQGGHAFRVMEAYEFAFESEGNKGQHALAILRLVGLFDRPLAAECFAALLKAPAIPGLTDPLVGVSEAQRNIAIRRLGDAMLLTVNRGAPGVLISLDAHPLLREYFSRQLRGQRSEAWRAGHKRVYEHLCATTNEGEAPTLEDLEPLYQAVAHGCQAGLHQQALDELYYRRIRREAEVYSTKKIGALGSDLGAIVWFFETPWNRVSPALKDADQAWMFNEAASRLGALGRLTEALEPMREGLEMHARQQDWPNAAGCAHNLSDLELALGKVDRAVEDAERSVAYADRSGDASHRSSKRTTYADALHQAGRLAEAEPLFRTAEDMQAEYDRGHPFLHAQRGFRYCDVLLSLPERSVWRGVLALGDRLPAAGLVRACDEVCQRARRSLGWVTPHGWLLDIALDRLTLGRATLYRDRLTNVTERIEHRVWAGVRRELDDALSGLRSAGYQRELPKALLTRAWLRQLAGECSGPDSARADLDDAWEIAERGPMRLIMADINLYRARLFYREPAYPWGSPEADLEAARQLIEQCGYGRRREELNDASAALKQYRAGVSPTETGGPS